MPKLEYPVQFPDGRIGVRCTQDIQNREAFLYVPYKMIITIGKVLNHPVVALIIKDNREAFEKANGNEKDDNDLNEKLILVLFIFHEMALIKQSYWLPYLR